MSRLLPGLLLLAALLATPSLASDPEHRLHLSLGGGAQAYLSDTRTMGGVGASVGLKDVYRDFLLLEADASYLFLIGNVFALRGGVGVQWPGLYSPAVSVNLGLLMGDRFSFLQPGLGSAGPTPSLTFGLVVSPIRFFTSRGIVSVLQLGAGLGTEFPGLGRSIYLGLLEISVPLR
ncbi:MAG: hypothetical protein M3Y59_11595 [Myxococcota bacterium]|nr:hypothetical protein [Myxococcota bacterium]